MLAIDLARRQGTAAEMSSKEFEMNALKRDDNEATSAELNVEQFSDGTSARRTKLLIERDNQTLTRLGKVPVLKVSKRVLLHKNA